MARMATFRLLGPHPRIDGRRAGRPSRKAAPGAIPFLLAARRRVLRPARADGTGCRQGKRRLERSSLDEHGAITAGVLLCERGRLGHKQSTICVVTDRDRMGGRQLVKPLSLL